MQQSFSREPQEEGDLSILRTMFGPQREEVWRSLAASTGSRYEEGGWFGKDRVVAEIGEWTVTLDTYTVSSGKHSRTCTRLRAPFVNPDGFRFSIRNRIEGLDTLGELFGLQDIEVGHPAFDAAYIIKGNDESAVRRLFADRRLREMLQAQPAVGFEVLDDEGWFGARFPEGVDELRFQVAGVIRDEARLRALFDLFAETLHALCRIGAAYEDDPGLVL